MEVATKRSLEELAAELLAASNRWHGAKLRHIKSGKIYRVVGVHFRESDMLICLEYTPLGSEFYNRVKFARSIGEMAFGTRFTCLGNV